MIHKPMKALSMTQPWASLFLTAEKQWETRSRRIVYRGWLAIHAASSMPFAAQRLCDREVIRKMLQEHCGTASPKKLVRGAIVGVVRITGCVEVERLSHPQGAELPRGKYELWLGDYTAGRFAWQREARVYRLPMPIPCKGALGLWDVPRDVEEAVVEQLGRQTGNGQWPPPA